MARAERVIEGWDSLSIKESLLAIVRAVMRDHLAALAEAKTADIQRRRRMTVIVEDIPVKKRVRA